jgi:hypothetical protein
MADTNVPVLVGAVPLLYVQSLTISEGYRIERIAGSKFSQAVAPTVKTISIEAVLPGADRFLQVKALEAMALTSRALVAATAPALKLAGIPVVSGLTVSLDMQITDLRFSQSVQKREAIDVSLTLQYVPRSSLAALLGDVAGLAVAPGTAFLSTGAAPSAIARTPGL